MTATNPVSALLQGLADGSVRIVELTQPLTETTPWPSAPSGRIPTAAADVCSLTYYCQRQDVHPKTQGYGVIAGLVVATLPKRS